MFLTRCHYQPGGSGPCVVLAAMLLTNLGCATVMGSWDYGLPKDNLSTEDRLWHIVFPLSLAAADQCVFKREDTYGFFLEDTAAPPDGHSSQTSQPHVRIRYVHAQLPAGKAGMAINDQVVAINGDPVTSQQAEAVSNQIQRLTRAKIQPLTLRLLHGHSEKEAGRALTREWVEDAAASTIVAVEESRATWNVWHLLAEAQRQARRSGIAREEVDQAVSEVVEAAISRSVRLGVDDPVAEPAQLRRPDGASVYDVHGATLYTSAKVLSAENELLALAARSGGHALADVRIEVAVAASAAKGFELNAAQVAMVRDLATQGLSSSSPSLLPAPARPPPCGSSPRLDRRRRHVIGLAPVRRRPQTNSRRPSTGHTDTLAKLTWTLAQAPAAAWPPAGSREIGPDPGHHRRGRQAATTDLTAAVRLHRLPRRRRPAGRRRPAARRRRRRRRPARHRSTRSAPPPSPK